MLTSLEKTVKNGGKIIAVNPLPEAGLMAFSHPQKISGLLGNATPLASQFLQVKINGDLAFLKGMIKYILQAEALAPGTVVDAKFIDKYTIGYASLVQESESVSWEMIAKQSGLSAEEIKQAAKTFIESKEAITCWAMGLTQHKNAVATIQEVVNLHLLLGKIGRPGSGLCPVRGHSNVQGDRTMGIWEKMPESFMKRLDEVFGFSAPRKEGFDTVAAIEAMHSGKVGVFFGMGGNFLSATPDTHFTAEALRRCRLTVQVSTKLNRGHLVTGKCGIILPCLGRTETDLQASGEQFVTVENSMGVVHRSIGKLKPASDKLLSEVAIVCRLASKVLQSVAQPDWANLYHDYDRIRDLIESVIPGFDDFNAKVREPGGFYLPNPAKERQFKTSSGKAEFSVNHLSQIQLEPGQLLLQTFRSHDQFNTTIYGMDDRYRGIKNERRVIFMNEEDMKERGIAPEEPVDITSHFESETRRAELFLAIPYSTPKGCVAAYYPEANVLVPIKAKADISHTPISKSVVVTVQPSCRKR
jgi:molybdopterin-dependent oxidoreductase alpha subunit